MKNLLIMLFILSMFFRGFSTSFAAEVMVGGEAMFTSKDIIDNAVNSNGVIHVINSVILPN